MKIAVDAMGGDNAPSAIVEGAVDAAREFGCEVILVGQAGVVEAELAKHRHDGLPVSILHATEVVGMDDSPSLAYRKKKDSSLRVGLQLVKDGQADAFVSAGNSGAVMTHAVLMLRLIPGISRAAITVLLPTQKGKAVLLDAGANVDCKPQVLFEFGIMGSVYAAHVLEKTHPAAGLLNIGEEEGKGNEIARLAGTMLRESSINFIGNLEAKQVYKGTADVIICDGFVGNISLKVSESAAEMFLKSLKDIFSRDWKSKLAYLLIKDGLADFKKKVDYHEVGGAPLLGINGAVFICHGSSNARSIKNAILAADKFAAGKVNDKIREGMEKNIEIEREMEKKEDLWNQIKSALKPHPQEGSEE